MVLPTQLVVPSIQKIVCPACTIASPSGEAATEVMIVRSVMAFMSHVCNRSVSGGNATKKPPGKGDASMKIEGGLVLKQALLEETGLETLPVPKVAYGDVKINGGQILPPQLAYVLHPTGHLADPMTIKVPYGLQLGPAPGVRTFGNKVVPPPPGLEEFDNGPESTYVYG